MLLLSSAAVADKTETLHEATLSAACRDLFKEKRADLLRLFYSTQNPEIPAAAAAAAEEATAAADAAAAAAASSLCLPSPCTTLWAEADDAPFSRPSQASRNLRESLLLLSLNKQNPGVETLPSGLQIRWLHRRQDALDEQERAQEP